MYQCLDCDKEKREDNDLYCTNPIAVQKLLDVEKFDNNVWECCNGLGHITNVLLDNGYKVRKSDIINYNNDDTEEIDILKYDKPYDGDIITNPPYKYATEIVYKLLQLTGNKVALYLNIAFLASMKRKELFEKFPPKVVYVMSKRYSCAKNGNFDLVNGSIDYCWIVWEKNHKGDTIIKWI